MRISVLRASQPEGRGFELGTFFGLVCVGSLWVPNTSTLGQIGDSKLAIGVNACLWLPVTLW